MKTLHELATKLQSFIIKCQTDAHNSTNLNVSKYNNLKLKMDTKLNFPNLIVVIGISEAVYNFAEGTKTDGGLGPDEKYVRKWLCSSNIVAELKEIWIAMGDLIKAEDEDKAIAMEGEADEAKLDEPTRKRRKQTAHQELSTVEKFVEQIEEAIKTEIRESQGISEEDEMLSYEQEQAKMFDDVHKGAPESIESIKQDLKNYLKSIYKKPN